MRADYLQIVWLTEKDFPEIIVSIRDLDHKIRFYLTDKSYIDVFLGGPEYPDRFNFHWVC